VFPNLEVDNDQKAGDDDQGWGAEQAWFES
jgi:hypothetical protein